jgi:hypothetical protein
MTTTERSVARESSCRDRENERAGVWLGLQLKKLLASTEVILVGVQKC